MTLHNRISRKELKQRMEADPTPRRTVSFYRYTPLADPKEFRDLLYRKFSELEVMGRVYVAHEGINAQVSMPVHNLQHFQDLLDSMPGLEKIRLNLAVDDNGKSFYVLDIKVRKQIVADGIADPAFDMQKKGRYVNAEEFNKLVADPNTIVIDMRNHYEYEVGHFKTAIEVPSDTFREQLPMVVNMMEPHRDQNIIMYCTGGIRCEKASAWMLHNGFKNVFHLEGGIINYTREVQDKGLHNEFIGKNFVFDERLGERITPDIIAKCHQCGQPADTHVNCRNNGCHLLFIQCPDCARKWEGCCSPECREILNLPVETQQQIRKGQDKGRNIFNKSRSRRGKLL